MDLKNMKYTPKERKEEQAEASLLGDAPMYPWGLCLNIEDEVADKLLSVLPTVGDEMMMQAIVKVTSVSQSDDERGGKRRSLSLQITDMALGPKEPKPSASERLYSKG